MRLRIAAAALAIGLCTAGVASADEVPPEFQNRPGQAACYNAVPTIVGSGVIFGGPGPDVIVGSNGPDVIHGLTGADVILWLGDDDVIFGGQGNDLVCAGWGEDYVQGGGDHDTVYGEAGFDYCPPSTENPVSCV
jgi:hypothetical protein